MDIIDIAIAKSKANTLTDTRTIVQKDLTPNASGVITTTTGAESYITKLKVRGATKVYKKLKADITWTEIVATETRDLVNYDYKLESVAASIKNNGISYPFYASDADKLANNVIKLHGVGSGYSELELLSDMTAKNSQSYGYITLNGSEVWTSATTNTGGKSRFACGIVTAMISKPVSTGAICDVVASSLMATSFDSSFAKNDGIAVSNTSGNIVIYTEATSGFTVAQFQSWLASNPVTLIYKLATPSVTIIPKSLVPKILTTVNNNISLDSTVTPNLFTATVPLNVSLLLDRITASGTTAQRPTPAFVGQPYFDTTLGKPINAKSINPVIWVDCNGVTV